MCAKGGQKRRDSEEGIEVAGNMCMVLHWCQSKSVGAFRLNLITHRDSSKIIRPRVDTFHVTSKLYAFTSNVTSDIVYFISIDALKFDVFDGGTEKLTIYGLQMSTSDYPVDFYLLVPTEMLPFGQHLPVQSSPSR